MKKNTLNSLILILVSVLLFSFSGFLYNKEKGKDAFAQEYKAKCAVEIPIGEAVDETALLAQEIIGVTEFIMQNAIQAADAGEALSKLPDQCKSENCQPPFCKLIMCTTEEGEEYCCGCVVLQPCQGDPCPTAEILNKVRQIEDKYKKIKVAYEGGTLNGEDVEGIKQLVKRPEEIFPLLGESRNKLKACSSPTEDYQKLLLEEGTSLKLVLNCENAKSMDPTLNACYLSNYFCCE